MTELSVNYQMDNALHILWERIREISKSKDLPTESRDLEILRLMDLQNDLDLEIQKEHEKKLNNLIQSLDLEEINAIPIMQTGLQAHIDFKVNNRKGARAISLKVKDVMENQASFPGYGTIKKITPQTAKDIADMQSRRKEMLNELVLIERKAEKSPEDIERKNQIMETLKMQQERIKGV
ncbi:hypothetical protein TVAG_351850 [Trichomonas vaginalis G3]|uniref:Uncharacterized protein n=1 Tax=Trichomonas vaginalis (strain ATCC PRA-98 / G3) TaxID=412133 RepID=A2DZR9_TRIV3|nr:hypothetical protein TVAGG3_0261420 [Trichomonas vaginalis G3]EAY14137.1 hypothetical protein TVAG_351850 [Trichomonas vaginalis G3]KAI5525147.1 hypothetical protein TVAGG3_0261420 [Trichomonas vaginalis G3]|eukprot:XP_001326360.1 hypothetical protein [Trichomonas vaginalis G3]